MPPPSPKDLRQERILSLKSMAEGLPGPENISEFGRALREFLQAEYRLNLTQPTDSELIGGIKNCDIPREEIARLERMLQKLTEAKYVGGSMPAYEFKSLQQDIVQYLQGKLIQGSTTPV